MISRFFLVLILVFGTAGSSLAEDRATTDEAKAMAEKAAQHIASAGLETAIADFMAPGGEWHDRDLYVFMFDPKGTSIAHGVRPAFVGRDLSKMRDVDGKPIIQEMLQIQDTGWVNYKWQNPSTNAVEPKASYIVRVGENIVGVGAYK